MSSLLNSHLPRFDSGEAKTTSSLARAITRDFLAEGHGDVLIPVDIPPVEEQAALPPEEGPAAADAEIDSDATPVEVPPDPLAIAQAEIDLRIAQLDEAAVSLSNTIAQVQIDAQAQFKTEIQNMAIQLFPLLGEAFLASEISEHIGKLVPPMVRSAEITASPEIADQLRDKISIPDGQSTDIKVTASDTAAPLQIKLSWGTGGFDYNFDELMTACAAHVSTNQAIAKE